MMSSGVCMSLSRGIVVTTLTAVKTTVSTAPRRMDEAMLRRTPSSSFAPKS